ncbi:MAG: hypothetical protein LBJ39_00415 [Tannerellaceae bacterium]|nr:hypothetical protein [Tannerellaceae bacterium]
MTSLVLQPQPTDEEKVDAVVTLNDEQKDVIRRDFIVKHLSDTSCGCKQSHLLLKFAPLHEGVSKPSY